MSDRRGTRRRRAAPEGRWARLYQALLGPMQRPSGRFAARPVGRRPSAAREGGPLRRPSYGQARRRAEYLPYLVAFAVIMAALGGFLYLGLSWATGPGRLAAIGSLPTPAPPAIPSPSALPSPSPSAVEQRTYVVRAGDTPDAIARRFGVSANELLRANRIEDPRTLQVGQTLVIPPPQR